MPNLLCKVIRKPLATWLRIGTVAGATFAGALTATLTAAHAQVLRKMVFGLPNATITASYCMLPTAIRLGFFAEEGIEVTIQPISGTATIYQTMLSERLDVAAATPEPIFQFYAKGDRRLIDVYNFIRKPTGSIAVLDESPIKKLEDFRGKKLGAMSLGSSNILLTNGVLSKIGLDPKRDITYLAVGVGPQALQAMRSKQVDGVILSDQYYVEMQAQGARLRFFEGEDQARLYSSQIMVRRALMEKEPDVIRGFGRALAKATLVAKENPEACVRLMWAEIPLTRRAGVPEEEQLRIDLAVINARMTLLSTPDSLANGWGWYNHNDVEAWNDFASSSGITDKKVDVNGMYTNQFVADYNKFDKDAVLKKAKDWRK